MEYYIEQIPITVKKKKIKNLYIRIHASDGQVIVSVPDKLSDDEIIDAIKAKESWIREKYLYYQEQLQSREAITVDNQEQMCKRLEAQLSELVPFWEQQTNLKCDGWKIKDMKSRWGSCNTKTHTITFNLQLAVMPLEFVEYVVLHELLHLRVPNHSAAFKTELNRYMPDWKMRKNSIK